MTKRPGSSIDAWKSRSPLGRRPATFCDPADRGQVQQVATANWHQHCRWDRTFCRDRHDCDARPRCDLHPAGTHYPGCGVRLGPWVAEASSAARIIDREAQGRTFAACKESSLGDLGRAASRPNLNSRSASTLCASIYKSGQKRTLSAESAKVGALFGTAAPQAIPTNTGRYACNHGSAFIAVRCSLRAA